MDPALNSKISRIRGWLMVALGSCLSLGIGMIAAFLALTIANNDRPGGTHWTGSHDFTVRVFVLFAAVFIFGLVALGGGVFQLRRGRPSRLAVFLLLGLAAVMFFLGRGILHTPG